MTDKAQPLDLATLDTGVASDKGAEFELKHPFTGKPTGIFVTVLGKHSQVFRDAIRDRTNDGIRKRALAERQGVDADVPTAEETEAAATDLLVACTTGWRTGEAPTITFEGKPLAFNVANARLLYSRLIWVRTQVDAAIGNLELFFKA